MSYAKGVARSKVTYSDWFIAVRYLAFSLDSQDLGFMHLNFIFTRELIF